MATTSIAGACSRHLTPLPQPKIRKKSRGNIFSISHTIIKVYYKTKVKEPQSINHTMEKALSIVITWHCTFKSVDELGGLDIPELEGSLPAAHQNLGVKRGLIINFVCSNVPACMRQVLTS